MVADKKAVAIRVRRDIYDELQKIAEVARISIADAADQVLRGKMRSATGVATVAEPLPDTLQAKKNEDGNFLSPDGNYYLLQGIEVWAKPGGEALIKVQGKIHTVRT